MNIRTSLEKWKHAAQLKHGTIDKAVDFVTKYAIRRYPSLQFWIESLVGDDSVFKQSSMGPATDISFLSSFYFTPLIYDTSSKDGSESVSDEFFKTQQKCIDHIEYVKNENNDAAKLIRLKLTPKQRNVLEIALVCLFTLDYYTEERDQLSEKSKLRLNSSEAYIRCRSR